MSKLNSRFLNTGAVIFVLVAVFWVVQAAVVGPVWVWGIAVLWALTGSIYMREVIRRRSRRG